MDSAGKRITQPPDRYQHPVSEINKKMSQATTTSTITTTSTSTTTLAGGQILTGHIRSKPETNADNSIRDMLTLMMAKNEEMRKSNEAALSTIKGQLDTCVQQWQLTDTRLTSLEDTQGLNTKRWAEQNKTNIQVAGRLTKLEAELLCIKENIQLSIPDHVSTIPMSEPRNAFHSTVLPPNMNPSGDMSSTYNNHPNYSQAIPDLSRTSFFQAQERLQDAVHEFSGQIRVLHPERFIAQLDTYFDTVPMSNVQQLLSAQRRLIGDARTWYESLIPTPRDYAEFKELFRQRFWSSATQRKARNDVFRPFQYNRSEGIANHAMQWIASSKYISPAIEQEDLVSIIIQHYPTPLGMALRGRGPRNTNDLLSILTEFEESTSFCETRREEYRPRPNQQQNNQGQYPPRGHPGNYRNPQRVPAPANTTDHHVEQLDVTGNDQELRQ